MEWPLEPQDAELDTHQLRSMTKQAHEQHMIFIRSMKTAQPEGVEIEIERA